MWTGTEADSERLVDQPSQKGPAPTERDQPPQKGRGPDKIPRVATGSTCALDIEAEIIEGSRCSLWVREHSTTLFPSPFPLLLPFFHYTLFGMPIVCQIRLQNFQLLIIDNRLFNIVTSWYIPINTYKYVFKKVFACRIKFN